MMQRALIVVVTVVLGMAPGVVSMQERRVIAGTGPKAALASQAVVAGGFVYVSGLVSRGPDGKVVGDDVQAQTRRILDQMKDVLTEAGSSMAQAVSVSVYLRYGSDFEAMNGVYREYFSDQPPTRTTVVADPPDGSLVAISAIAVPNGAPRETLHPAGWMKSPRPYSYIVRAGDFVFFSGLVSRRGTDDQFVPGWVRDQVKTILGNANVLLKTAGLTFDNVVASRVFITDPSFFEEMNDEYRKVFTTAPPARATAVTQLMGPETLAEITLVATTLEKQIIGPVVTPSLPLSTAVRAGRHVFFSGMLGNTDANATDLSGQTTETLTKVTRALDLAGLKMSDIVDNTIYVPDLYQHDMVDKVYGPAVGPIPPARTMVGVRLVQKTGLVEMMMTGWK